MKIEFFNLYVHFLFTVMHKAPLISEPIRDRVEKYISGIVANLDSRVYAIYAGVDHMHILISKSPRITEECIARTISEASSKFINENKLCNTPFLWQGTAWAFSVSKDMVTPTCAFILNQNSFHQSTGLEEELKNFQKHYQKTIIPKD